MPCHVLLGLICGPEGIGRSAMLACSANLKDLRDKVVTGWPARRVIAIPDGARLRLHAGTHRVVREAIEQSHGLGQNWVGTEHLLLALCTRGDWTTRRYLLGAGISHERVRTFIVQNMAAIGGIDVAVEAAHTNPK